jgi:hypothetical protein
LLEIPCYERAGTDAEIAKKTTGTVEALKQFDALFAMLRIKNGATVDCNFVDARKHAKEALASWRRLKLSITVKAHLLESHAIEQMIRFGGIGDFAEDFIEQAHQWGESEERRTHGLRDRSRAANAHSKWEFMRMNPLVTKAVEEAGDAKKRKVSVNAPGRMAKQAKDELALNKKLTQRAELRSDDREVADLRKHIMSADENAKLDCKVANSM